MPQPALLLLIATLLPLASVVLLVFTGKRLGKPLAGWVATAAIGASAILSWYAMVLWLNAGSSFSAETWGMGKLPIAIPFQWVPVIWGATVEKTQFLDIGIYVDSLTIVMFAMVTAVSFLVHVFSIGYMAEDKRFPRFFTYLGLFCFSMLGLVLGGTILQLFIFWELVGLCSYLLIGFWYEKKSASNAAIKAFVVNRVGDFGFLIGFGILFYLLGNATLPDVWAALDVSKIKEGGLPLNGSTIGVGMLTIMGIGLFFGAVGKSAQFPLHVWLPDAMEGPTPVSALIHAATMVAAGVYLVGRIFPILTPDARVFIAIIGCVTLTMAALIAIAQSDIKKVLAYSTLSQLGYMILALGIGSWVGGLFHLITHAFFKALLFLGSGSVIYAAHHEQDMKNYGGLMWKIPVTAATFFVAVLAIAGFSIAGWGFSGFYSKDMILEHAGAFWWVAQSEHAGRFFGLLFIMPTIIAFVTPFYMMRCWMLTFWGKPRDHHVYDHAHERPVMWLPLVVLAVLSVIGGYDKTYIKELIRSARDENTAYVQKHVEGAQEFNGFRDAWPVAKMGDAHAEHSKALEHGLGLVHKWILPAPWVGLLLGFALYFKGYAVANVLMKIPPLRWIHTWLLRRMYFDELYMSVIVGFTLLIARLGSAIDKYIIDGIVNGAAKLVRGLSDLSGLNDRYVVDGAVNGVALATSELGDAVRAPQTGRIRVYVMILLAAVALCVAGATTVLVLGMQ